VLVLDQVLLRLLDGDREVGFRLLGELKTVQYYMDFLGIQIYMYGYVLPKNPRESLLPLSPGREPAQDQCE
jgi:hypothetical protein